MALVESLEEAFNTLKLQNSIYARLEASTLQFDRATNATRRTREKLKEELHQSWDQQDLIVRRYNYIKDGRSS